MTHKGEGKARIKRWLLRAFVWTIKCMVVTFTELRKRRQVCWGKDNKFNSGYVVKEAGYLLSGSQEKEMRCYIDLRLYLLIEHIDFN